MITLPGQPTGVSATQRPGSEVRLGWGDPDDASITAWEYRQSSDEAALDSADWMPIDGSDAQTTTYVAGGLETGTTYHFQVRATNRAGAGEASHTVDATAVAKLVTIAEAPDAPQTVSAAAGAEAAALHLPLAAEGGDVAVSSFGLRVAAAGRGKVADIATVKVYRDADGDGPEPDELVGEAAPDADGTVSIGLGDRLTVVRDDTAHLVFALQFAPRLAAAGGVSLLGALLAFAATRRVRGGGRVRGAGRAAAAALLALALVLAVAGCKKALPDGPSPGEAASYQLTLRSVTVEGDDTGVTGLPPEGITGATVTIDW